ncbi:alpha-ketoglutarate-dependent dioxygenase AlkB [Glaciecola sp.]|nr:alpha-ketoglutarate-dependent dioxygenase AlkB [Glaciecola sp.]
MQLFDTPQIAMVDADVQYYPNWLGISDADAFFAQLKQNLSWSQDYIRIYGRDVKIPRLQCWMGDPAATYTYSGLQMQPVGWAEPVKQIKDYCEQVTGHSFNSVLANWYRDGQDSMGMHSDDEPELGAQPVIASVTLGEPRKFIFKHKQLGIKHEIPLAHGSLLVMRGTTQQYWQHGINKTKRVIDDRINLTFRYIFNN